MFAKKARAQHFDYGPRRDPAAARPGNDNQRQLRAVAPVRHARRPVLFAHWQTTPDGRLECHWHSATARSATDEGVSWLADRCGLTVAPLRLASCSLGYIL
jgi:hypothetical protein